MRKLAVYALGGNALQPPKASSSTSVEVLARVMSDVIDLLEMDWSVIITKGHGNSSTWSNFKVLVLREIRKSGPTRGPNSSLL